MSREAHSYLAMVAVIIPSVMLVVVIVRSIRVPRKPKPRSLDMKTMQEISSREEQQLSNRLVLLFREFVLNPIDFRQRWGGRRLTFRATVTDRIEAEDGRMLVQVEIPTTQIPVVAICQLQRDQAWVIRRQPLGRPLTVSARLDVVQECVPQFLFVDCRMQGDV